MPIEELRKRDVKGIYCSYDKGEVFNVAGLDLKVDEPKSPDQLFDFNDRSFTVSEMVDLVISKLNL